LKRIEKIKKQSPVGWLLERLQQI